MGHRANSFRRSRPERTPRQQTRAIVTALAVQDDHLLMTQLARGPFAGFWLLPSATADAGTVADTLRTMLPARAGYTLAESRLVSVVEEPKPGVLAMRFVFRVWVGAEMDLTDDEIARVQWFSREAVREVLAERDVVPNLGVMSLVRAWEAQTPLRPLELLVEDALCPCGSGFRYPGCCGWDAR